VYKCKHCGKAFEGRKKKFCSIECQRAHYPTKRISKKLLKRECVNCGKSFETRSYIRKCCSPSCVRSRCIKKHIGIVPIYICKKCGKEFGPKKGNSVNPGKARKYLYCSRECSDKRERKKRGRNERPKFCKIVSVNCLECGEVVIKRPHFGKRYFCSSKCQALWMNRRAKERYIPKISNVLCIWCGQSFDTNRYNFRFCSTKCKKENEKIAKYNNHLRRRMHLREGFIEQIKPLEIFMRDGWKCGICGGKINRNVIAPHPMSASIDHIIPISKGGQHIRTNVRCSHFICNNRKSDNISIGGDQMRLM